MVNFADGIVIMWLGMAVVFTFLLFIMIFIRLLGVFTPQTLCSKQAAIPVKEIDDGVALAAAIAVAIEYYQKPTAGDLRFGIQIDPGAAWRIVGRSTLQQSVQFDSSVFRAWRSVK